MEGHQKVQGEQRPVQGQEGLARVSRAIPAAQCRLQLCAARLFTSPLIGLAAPLEALHRDTPGSESSKEHRGLMRSLPQDSIDALAVYCPGE